MEGKVSTGLILAPSLMYSYGLLSWEATLEGFPIRIAVLGEWVTGKKGIGKKVMGKKVMGNKTHQKGVTLVATVEFSHF